jgi:ATP-binding cassette subfamily E protein 1
MRLAIVHKEKCRPEICHKKCEVVCPVNKKGEQCVIVDVTAGEKAKIDEKLCIGCAICQNRCPLEAIEIVNLPSVDEKNLIYRYGENGFALYGLPIPKENSVLGLLGRNGIGKSTAVELLAGKKAINLGKEEASKEDVKKFLQGTELLRYFNSLEKEKKKIAYKPQNLAFLFADVKAIDLLKKKGSEKKIKQLAEKLGVEHLLENKLNKLSGGELQKIAILTASVSDADIYFFDEPLAFLDISERLKVSDFIKELSLEGKKTVVVVEHDLLIMDYLTDFLNIFYGQQGCFGAVSGLKKTRYGINSYLQGYLREENMKIRDKELNFNFNKSSSLKGMELASWSDFKKEYDKFKLEVKAGQIHGNHVIGILGKNGTGKTSFVKALAGLEEVSIDGKKQKLEFDLKISYKPQYLFNEESETVQQIMVKEKINKKLASMFNLETLHMKKVKELSGGELQRLAIARCLAKDADLYLIDEPSAYLDVEDRIACAKAIKDIMIEKEKTAFVVDHDLLLISYVADNIMVFSGEPGKHGKSSDVMDFSDGISLLLKELDITLRKDKEYGRPRINDKGSVLDREQKAAGKYVEF